jgi:two-component system LytT family response regulator
MTMERLRLLIADDEPLARDLLRRYVEKCSDLVIAEECATGDEFAAALRSVRVDIALLDIRMPGEDVFEVLAQASGHLTVPFVVFATAFDIYAVRAFELNAVDYLVKPFTFDRFVQAMRRVRDRRASGMPQEELAAVIRDLGRRPDRFLVPQRDRMIPIAIQDIAWIQAEGDYSRIHSGTKSYVISRTLKDLESRLDPNRFIRIHRSAIVSTDHIREVHPQGSSRFRVVLSSGTTLIVSRTRSQALRRWML